MPLLLVTGGSTPRDGSLMAEGDSAARVDDLSIAVDDPTAIPDDPMAPDKIPAIDNSAATLGDPMAVEDLAMPPDNSMATRHGGDGAQNVGESHRILPQFP